MPVIETGTVEARVFGRWSMAMVSDDGESDIPLLMNVDKGGISPAAPRPTTPRAGERPGVHAQLGARRCQVTVYRLTECRHHLLGSWAGGAGSTATSPLIEPSVDLRLARSAAIHSTGVRRAPARGSGFRRLLSAGPRRAGQRA